MRSGRWRLGLYGRIALGCIALIAVVLAIQGAIFVWLVDRSNDENMREQAQRLALTRALSAQLSHELQTMPDLNLGARISELGRGERVFAILKDGRVIGSRPPLSVIDVVITEFHRLRDDDPIPASWEITQYAGRPLTVNGKAIGVLGTVPRTPLERFGPQVLAIGLGLLTIGTLVSSTVIVGPVRSRLRDLQRAADRLGQGDQTARAREDGSDEVAELALAFNTMADELGQRASALEVSDRLRRQLIADVSHELMTPLTAVLGHLETLTMDEVRLDDAQRMKQVDITTREARRLERLIGDLLIAARLEAGGIELDVQNISTRELFEQLATRHEYECRTRQVRLVTVVAPGADTLAADPFRIDQALDNLITNALRHTPSGGVIELKASKDEQAIVLEVSDSGEGIPPEHLPFIFDRFYKASSTKGIASRGSGLGLSIVKAIVTRHGGRVSATSTPGAGATVKIKMPAPVAMPAA